MAELISIFRNNKGNLIDKWIHYFEIYEQFFSKYVNTDVVILEIGIYQGGSIKMWKEYFGPRAKIYAIDINPECKQFEQEGVEIFIGSQDDRSFLQSVKARIPKVDILIDDGGHTMKQQIVSFEELFDHVKDGGVYLCEDLHTSYWPEYGGGLRNPESFIEYSKDFVDQMNGWHYNKVNKITRSARALHYFDSVLVIEKRSLDKPYSEKVGQKVLPDDHFDPNLKPVNKYRYYIRLLWNRLKKVF